MIVSIDEASLLLEHKHFGRLQTASVCLSFPRASLTLKKDCSEIKNEQLNGKKLRGSAIDEQ